MDEITNQVIQYIKVDLNQNQFDALISLVYNYGIGNFIKTNLYKKINQNPNDPSIKSEFLKITKSGGQERAGLKKRRDFEALLYFDKQGVEEEPKKRVVSQSKIY